MRMDEARATLTFELGPDGDELYINCDREGLHELITHLQKLANSSRPLPNDIHLMTESWAGYELSEDQQLEGSTLLNKVTVRLA